MKKSKKILLSTLLMCPALVLTACVPPPSYLISTSSSDTTWGRAIGAFGEEMAEGTEITLTAIETSSENHPFICWVKDYNLFYSNEKEMTLNYSEETKGHYTAVFADDASKMLFSSFRSITIESTQYTNIEYTLNYSASSSGSNNYIKFSEGTFDPNNPFYTDMTSIFYFGSLGSEIEYKFEMVFTLTDNQGTITNHNLKFTQKIDNNTFGNHQSCEISETIAESNITFKLAFDKLAQGMYNLPEEEE